MLRDATQATLFDILEASKIPFEHNKAENTLLMKDTGSRILFRPVDEFERLRGTNLAWFGLDELTYTQEAAWLRLEGRLRDPQVSVPGGYLYTLSVYVRSSSPTVVTLLLGVERADRVCGIGWQRITFSTRGDAAAASCEFGLELPAKASVEVFGLQVEPQAAASTYKSSTDGGVYENAYFRYDTLAATTTDINHNAVTVKIVNADSL
jgi:hypothetical protein